MQVTLEIPDTLAAELIAAGKDPARAALEALLVDGYPKRHTFAGEIKQTLAYRTRIGQVVDEQASSLAGSPYAGPNRSSAASETRRRRARSNHPGAFRCCRKSAAH